MSDEPARLCRAEGADAGCVGAAAAVFGPAQLCGLKSECVVESYVFCLGVSLLPEDRGKLCAPCTH